MKTVIVSVLVIIGACATLPRTRRPEPGLVETKTQHVKGQPHEAWPGLGEP